MDFGGINGRNFLERPNGYFKVDQEKETELLVLELNVDFLIFFDPLFGKAFMG